MRLSHVPGELLDDRKVSTPRGMAIKIFDAEGPKVAGHEGENTHDFVLDTGKARDSIECALGPGSPRLGVQCHGAH